MKLFAESFTQLHTIFLVRNIDTVYVYNNIGQKASKALKN